MHIITCCSEKGGVGKSATAMNLAACLSRSARCIVIDVDPQRTASEWAETAGERLPFDFDADTDPAILGRIRDVLSDDYDLVFVDTPGSLSGMPVLRAVIEQTDMAILPVEASIASIKPTRRTIDTLIVPAGVRYKALLNRTDTRTTWDTEEIRGAFTDLGVPLFAQDIRSYAAIRRGMIDGTVITQERGSEAKNAVDAYQTVAMELLTDLTRTPNPKEVQA